MVFMSSILKRTEHDRRVGGVVGDTDDQVCESTSTIDLLSSSHFTATDGQLYDQSAGLTVDRGVHSSLHERLIQFDHGCLYPAEPDSCWITRLLLHRSAQAPTRPGSPATGDSRVESEVVSQCLHPSYSSHQVANTLLRMALEKYSCVIVDTGNLLASDSFKRKALLLPAAEVSYRLSYEPKSMQTNALVIILGHGRNQRDS